MRYVFLSKNVGSINRGAETFAIELSTAIRAKGFETECLILNNEVSDCRTIKLNIFQRAVIKILGLIGDIILKMTFGRFPLISSDALETFYFHKNSIILLKENDVAIINSMPIGLAEFRDKKIKTFYVGHSGIGAHDRCAFLFRRKIDYFICLTPVYLQWARKYVPDAALKLITNGVALDKFRLKISDPKIEKDISINIVCVAALESFKRQELLIKCLPFDNRIKLTLIGMGPDKVRLQTLARSLGVDERLEIKSVPYVDMGEEYSKFDIFCLTSLNEPFGIVYLEALASGIPVVTVNDSARNYILDEHAYYCATMDPVDILNSIYMAHKENINNREASIKRREYVNSRFSWEKIASSYVNIAVLNENRYESEI